MHGFKAQANHLQKSYPVLPAENEVHLSFFNGMSDNCGMPVFKMTYPDPVSGNEVAFNIDFKNFNKYPDDPSRDRNYVVSKMFPNTDFTIHSTSVKCNEADISFPELKLPKFPVSCPLLGLPLESLWVPREGKANTPSGIIMHL